jgi:hypothetical protein
MTPVPVSAVITVPIIIMMIIEFGMAVFSRAIISAAVFVFFDCAPGCHQQTGQAE